MATLKKVKNQPHRSGILLLAVFYWCAGITCFAQNPTTLQGTVRDEKGAVISGATVVLTDKEGQQTPISTDADGNFSAHSVGKFTVTVNAAGFAEDRATVELETAKITRLEITLKITVNARVEVRLRVNNLNTVALNAAQIKALPADAMQFQLYLQHLANAHGAENNLVVYVDGFREDGNLPPKEAIAAILITTDAYAAEFSEPGRARVEIITKPATERLRGELNFVFNNQSLNARNPFALNRPPLQTRNFSAVLSAPLQREKWGYFLEFSRNSQEENAYINALTLNPATLQPTTFNSTVLTPAQTTGFSVRSNKIFGTRHTLDGRFNVSDENAANQDLQSGFDLAERGVNRKRRENSLRFSLISAFNERTLNEARVSLTRNHSLSTANNTGAAILVLDFFNAGGNQDALALDDQSDNLRAEDNFSYLAGNHSLKFGAVLNPVKFRNTDRANSGGTFVFGTDFDRGANGFPLSGASLITPLESYRRTVLRRAGYRPLQFVINQGDPFVGLTQIEAGFFAQDDWKLAERISLSYGLRGEFQTNLDGKLNFAPRLGVAVRPFKNIESSLRVGAGFFYSRVESGISINARRYNGVKVEELTIPRPPFFPLVPEEFNRATAQTTRQTKAADLTAPYNFISNISYEQQLTKNVTASIGYTFERGVHLLRTRNINAPVNGIRPNPLFGPIFQTESSGILKRHDLIAGAQAEFGDKLSFYSSYRLILAKNDTDGATSAPANPYNLANEFGRSSLDQRQQFYFEANAELPFDISVSPNLFIGSGTPFDITTGSDNNGDTVFTDRPAFANASDGGAIVTNFGIFNLSPQTGDRIIPRNFGRGAGEISFNLNIAKTFSFGAETVDSPNCRGSRLHCGFINRQYGLTLTADAYNLLNHTNFGDFNGVLTSPLFGKPNRANDARKINIGVSFSF